MSPIAHGSEASDMTCQTISQHGKINSGSFPSTVIIITAINSFPPPHLFCQWFWIRQTFYNPSLLSTHFPPHAPHSISFLSPSSLPDFTSVLWPSLPRPPQPQILMRPDWIFSSIPRQSRKLKTLCKHCLITGDILRQLKTAGSLMTATTLSVVTMCCPRDDGFELEAYV